ncbi:magnesium transporter CorA family protein [Falsirhodobacter halotolerans]|uniref:magnesium transporter CorA family protein n=1 Tax=Falsirhodobacter halotolerans TaxID=1146892 RepID=UPI001FD61CAA|nr:magnesium transporter CorA family protein [Falsirhodobacter halotolerans]MCJ8138844.1 magnesium transporter CorA family protein [Falsirhodobacter halotolerans]
MPAPPGAGIFARMIAHHILTDGKLVAHDGLPQGRALWIDLCSPTADEEHAVEALIGAPVPTRDEMSDIEDSARLYIEGAALVMTAVVIEGANKGRPRRSQITFLLMPDRLVTVRHADPLPLGTIATRVARHPGESDTAPRLLATMLEAFVERIADVLEKVSADLADLSDSVFFDADEGSGMAEQDLRKLVRRLGRKNRTLSILRESILSFDRLIPFLRDAASGHAARTEDEDLPPLAHMSPKGVARLKAIHRDVTSLSTALAQVEAELSFLHSATVGLIGVEQNQIIKVLSIATALFLPPTLVGTIYGMNFDHMPELHWAVGYPLALAAMGISAVLPFLWFRRKNWL